MPKKLKHDLYLEILQDKLMSDYDIIFTNVPLYSKKRNKLRRIAEIDILAIKDNVRDVFEVKCSYRRAKARKQLHRIRRIMPEVNQTYFFCGEADLLENII